MFQFGLAGQPSAGWPVARHGVSSDRERKGRTVDGMDTPLNLANFATLYNYLDLNEDQDHDNLARLTQDLVMYTAGLDLIFVQAYIRPGHLSKTATVFLFTRDRVVVVEVIRLSREHTFGEPARTEHVTCVPLSQVERLCLPEAGFDAALSEGARIIAVLLMPSGKDPSAVASDVWRAGHVLRLPEDVDVLVEQDLDADFEGGKLATFGNLEELLAAVGAAQPNV